MTAPARAQRPFSVKDEAPERSFRRIGDGHYMLAAPDLLVDLDVDHVRRERHQLHGELTVRCGVPGLATINGVLIVASVNLSSLRDRDAVARTLCSRIRTPHDAGADPWRALVDELSIHVSTAERTGDPAVALRDVPRRGADRWLRALGFALPEALPSMIFGDGDTLKTLTADAIAVSLARQGVRVGIVDAELSVDEHAERVARIAAGRIPEGLVYLSCARPLIYDRDRIAEMVRTHQLTYLIFDSVGFLCHDKPESAESAMEYFRAVRAFSLGSLHIAHTNRSDSSDLKPFGSVYWFNSVRALWYARRAEAAASDSAATSTVDVGYYPRKYNLGARPETHALRFAFRDGVTQVIQTDPSTITSIAAGMPIKERVRQALRAGARTLPELAAEIADVDAGSLRRTIDRYSGERAKFRLFVKLPGDRFGLAESRREDAV